MIRSTAVLFAACAAAALAHSPADAQGGALGRMRERVKQRIEERVGDRADRAVDAALGANPAGTTPGGTAAAPPANAHPGQGAWVNYDFVPGSRPLFVTDFSADNVGDFPRRLRLESGNMQVAEVQGRRWLHTTDGGTLVIPLPETLPQRFTIEFDFVPGSPTHGNRLELCHSGRCSPFAQINWTGGGTVNVYSSQDDARTEGRAASLEGKTTPIRVMVDGSYVKVYAGGARVINMPNAQFTRGRELRLQLSNGEGGQATMVGNLSVMAGGKRLYDALSREGRVATQGILFDTGSDRIRPESTPTLREITAMLREYAGLRIAVEGHTDDAGQAAANQALSERRAAAVRAFLVAQGIDAARVQSRGLGASRPAAPNATPEGRRQNRRVELVRL
ncbi:MAG: hypothetical protein AVDCRST_MAG68-4654 [uncultured Gemmatimonadetes bacterium]|uniref:OmpA-like domain-containing protein n=1 Tax=uncultured Gemmatimonadota bacterium TaxID=203437 RepID=A0A6J4MMH0_9BACT|nr:MAG: hypothetical protein AVDCRST_MAG68-4654 [uncultured Gemmatimonadota bacterium]